MIGRPLPGQHDRDLLLPDGTLAWLGRVRPVAVPAPWRLIVDGLDGALYETPRAQGLRLILSGSTEADGKKWLHLSLSHRSRLPTWDEFRDAKEAFLGDRYALSVLPPRSRYVNIAPRVLHCFAPLEAWDWPLPEFSGVVDGFRTL